VAAYCLFDLHMGNLKAYHILGFALGAVLYLAGLSGFVRGGVFRVLAWLRGLKRRLLRTALGKKLLH
jgi:hypothetical protein